MYDLARLGGQFAAGRQMEPDEVEGPLPFHRPGGAPGGVDVLELFAPLVRQGAGR
ncbi:hypothetical protein [Streptomyces pharetrae]|uniref:hypothetical protein n=1 Tax=Streptomyces pharetrae TaxID=291370 RepID=UPI001302253A